MGNPVVTFLTTRNGYTFEEGVAVFAMYTADRFAVERIRRSRDMRMLVQELKKLAQHPALRPVKGYVPNPAIEQKAEEKPKVQPKPIAKTESNNTTAPKKVITFEDLKHHKWTKFEEMPTPMTQKLWKENQEEYHVKLDLFTRMKQCGEGDELAELRSKVVELGRRIRDRWHLIDELCREHYEEHPKPTKVDFNVSTYRSYITKALKKDLTDRQLVELQKRVDAMLTAKVAISDETLARLREKGISC